MSTEEDIEELTQIFGKLISENEYIQKCYSKKKEKVTYIGSHLIN